MIRVPMKFDHIEVFVPNREEAAAWYVSVFGFRVVDRFRDGGNGVRYSSQFSSQFFTNWRIMLV